MRSQADLSPAKGRLRPSSTGYAGRGETEPVAKHRCIAIEAAPARGYMILGTRLGSQDGAQSRNRGLAASWRPRAEMARRPHDAARRRDRAGHRAPLWARRTAAPPRASVLV